MHRDARRFALSFALLAAAATAQDWTVDPGLANPPRVFGWHAGRQRLLAVDNASHALLYGPTPVAAAVTASTCGNGPRPAVVRPSGDRQHAARAPRSQRQRAGLRRVVAADGVDRLGALSNRAELLVGD